MSTAYTGEGPSHAVWELQVALETGLRNAATAHRDEMPGLTELLETEVVVHLSLNDSPGTLGLFCSRGLSVRGYEVSEIHVNVMSTLAHFDTRHRSEQLMTTLLHEAAHAYNHAQGIKDTSRGGRYHNSNFGRAALALGLAVEANPRVGVHTPGLQPESRIKLCDELDALSKALVLDRVGISPRSGRGGGNADPIEKLTGTGPFSARPKHISATCICVPPRFIRVASGTWLLGPIRCGVCDEEFTDILTGPRQDSERPANQRAVPQEGVTPR